MFLPQEVKPMIRQGFLCLRRDVSKVIEFNGSKIMFSLLAEMFLPRRRSRQTNGGSLFLRRDVSLLLERRTAYNMFSLHAQRCFPQQREFFSIQVSFLCMRRDVSFIVSSGTHSRKFSLHVQRCFPHIITNFILVEVFSACAEMFLLLFVLDGVLLRFLCIRRDCLVISSLIVLLKNCFIFCSY